MDSKIKKCPILFLVFLGLAVYGVANATDSLTRTTTGRNQTIFTNNSDCRGNEGDVCRGSSQQGGITMNINGGALNFNLCGQGIDVNPSDIRCRVTPPMIPPGADTQVGTGLNPTTINDNGATVSFGGPTNDPIPSGSSNVMIPGFLVHGAVGEQTLRCLSEATCGTLDNSGSERIILTHFQSFRSVPTGQIINPANPGVLCDQPRCTHIEYSIEQNMFGDAAAGTAMRFNYIVDSKTDVNGNLILTAPGTPTGTYTVTCLAGASDCANTSGNFRVNTNVFTSASTGFVTMNDSPVTNPAGCPSGSLVDPFHQNNVSCRSGN